MTKPDVDYSLYLVTDSTPAILGTQDLADVVEAACRGGVTVVQYREKLRDTGALVRTARRLHAVTRRHGVPLLINDRVDVALAVGCEGVHIGQDDMDLATARRLLGPDAIIGVTASTADEALAAAAVPGGADYLGIGTVFATATKDNAKHIIGTAGLRSILARLADEGHAGLRTVCIGGVNASNVQRVLYQSAAPAKPLDGVAVVSAVVAAADPAAASRQLLDLVRSPPPFTRGVLAAADASSSASALLAQVPGVVRAVAEVGPLSHNMTNLVVQNFAANVALAVGASPIMANFGDEAVDLAALGGALVVNMGTVTPEGLDNYAKALRAYNAVGQPVVFDPVGANGSSAGATAVRRGAVRTLLAAGFLDVIKGNEGEITTVLGEGPARQQKGVDSTPSSLDGAARAGLVRRLAARERNVVLMTGATDYVSDGARTFAVANGHPVLGQVTGTGCALGTTVSAMVAAQRARGGGDRLAAVVAGLLHYEIAAERAAARADVQGPGTFVPAFLDELARVRQMTVDGDLAWLAAAKVTEVSDV